MVCCEVTFSTEGYIHKQYPNPNPSKAGGQDEKYVRTFVVL